MNRSFWRGVATGVLLTILFVGAWDLRVSGVTIWRGWPGRIADALHEWHGGEAHDDRN